MAERASGIAGPMSAPTDRGSAHRSAAAVTPATSQALDPTGRIARVST